MDTATQFRSPKPTGGEVYVHKTKESSSSNYLYLITIGLMAILSTSLICFALHYNSAGQKELIREEFKLQNERIEQYIDSRIAQFQNIKTNQLRPPTHKLKIGKPKVQHL